MAGNGTGSPLTFRCSRCRGWRHTGHTHLGRIERVRLTGRVRPEFAKVGRLGTTRCRAWSAEYDCRDCGHTGWSSHPSLISTVEYILGRELPKVPVRGQDSAFRFDPNAP